MADLPAGTVTFLFTDIEGSTRLLKQLGERYADALADHQRILRECFDAHHGREIDTQGDSFFVAFARAGDGVAAAIDAQRALANHTWPDGAQLRVRMGLHSGEPRATGERYVGFGVHRAARVGAVGHGGQILLTNATRELVEDELPQSTRLDDLGSYRLKDVDRPEQLFQVQADGLRRAFPPLSAPRVSGPRRMRKLWVAIGALVAVAAAGIAIAYATKKSDSAVGSAGNPITIATVWAENAPEEKAFIDVLSTFEETTGLHVKVQPLGVSDSSEISERVRSHPVMVALVPSPGVLADLAHAGIAKPLASVGISDERLRRSYGKTWIDLAAVDGRTYGFPAKTSSKSLVWYRPDDLRRLGLRVPKTWRQLMAVTAKIKRGGGTPWALGAGNAWTLTDWFENLYIQTAGPWKYDGLFTGKLPFDDPSVLAAVRRMSSILNDGTVVGGVSSALETTYPDAIASVFGPNPPAHLYMEGGFVGDLALAYPKPTPQPGKTIAATVFPRIDSRLGSEAVVGADFVAALDDDPAIGKLLRYLSSPGAGRIWVSSGAIVSPNKRVESSAYPNDLVLAEARQLKDARVVRFDGSDLLPERLGAELGSTLQDVIQDPTRATKLMQAFQRKAAQVFGAA